MEAARATWSDSRLDDLSERVKSMDTKMDAGFTRTNERIDKLEHTIIVVGGSLFAAFVAFLAAILGLIITLIVLHS